MNPENLQLLNHLLSGLTSPLDQSEAHLDETLRAMLEHEEGGGFLLTHLLNATTSHEKFMSACEAHPRSAELLRTCAAMSMSQSLQRVGRLLKEEAA